jgi:transposase InsO family protein
VVIDLFSRQVIGWSLREDMTHDIVIDALRMAWFKRHPSKQAGLIFHSDRGGGSMQLRKLLLRPLQLPRGHPSEGLLCYLSAGRRIAVKKFLISQRGELCMHIVKSSPEQEIHNGR